MSTYADKLPSDPRTRARLIENHVQRERSRASYKRVMWSLAWNYLQGARHFDRINLADGSVSPHFIKQSDGSLYFQVHEITRTLDQAIGRLMSADWRIAVGRADTSTAAIRERAAAQVLGDAILSSHQVQDVARRASTLLMCLGCCGIAGTVNSLGSAGLVGDLEVVHPKELLPWPSLGPDLSGQSGLVRTRLVPLWWLRDKLGIKNLSDERLTRMKVWKVLPGDDKSTLDISSDNPSHGGSVEYNTGTPMSTGGENKVPKDLETWVRINEVWIKGHQDRLAQYSISSGEESLMFKEFAEDEEAWCSISVMRAIENGSFWGMGYFELLFGVNRELEHLLLSLCQNVRDIDKFGVLVMPRGQYSKNDMLRDVGKGLRVLNIEPDPNLVEAGFEPFMVQPHTTGDFPGKVSSFMKQIYDGLSPVRDLIEEKGRVESAAGLQRLEEIQNQAITTATNSINMCMGTVYRSMVHQAAALAITTDASIPLTRIDINLAGVVIDPTTNSVSFRRNPLPQVGRLMFGVKDMQPKSELVKKQAAVEMFTLGLSTDPNRLYAYLMREGINIEMWLEDYESAYATGVLDIIRLFGDGQQPGEVQLNPYTAKPDFQLMLVNSFVGGYLFQSASPEVQEAFFEYIDTLRTWLGAVMPEGMPNLRDAAMLEGMASAPGVPQ